MSCLTLYKDFINILSSTFQRRRNDGCPFKQNMSAAGVDFEKKSIRSEIAYEKQITKTVNKNL